MRHIVMIGGMGVGKSTVGGLVAEDLGLPFVDSDDEIRGLTGKSARQVAEADGVAALHEMEFDVLDSALARRDGAVIAAAASVVDHPDAVALLEDALCYWIDRPVVRDGSGEDHRRVIDASEEIDERSAAYAALADLTVSGPGGPEEYAAGVVQHVRSTESNNVS